MKKISIFDFDNTLCLTPDPKQGREIYKKKTGNVWPYGGWWGRKESLNLDIFEIPLNLPVYQRYLDSKDSYLVLATGRLFNLKAEVLKILSKYNLKFDEVHLNPGCETYQFKKDLFEKIITKNKPDKVLMYDDRQTHLAKFKDWALNQPCEVEVIDVNLLK